MSTLLFANNAQTTLAGPIASGALSVNVAAGTGQEFPSPNAGQYFVMTFTDTATGLLHEIVWVTARANDTLTVVRAQEGTIARSWLAGDIAGNWWTAGSAATMVQVQTLQTQPGNYAVDTGSANNIQIALNPTPTSLTSIAGAPIRVLVKFTNTAATTLTIAGLASTVVFAQSGSTASLPAGGVVGGQIYEFIYTPGLGFEVATAKVLLSTANTWAAAQTELNSVFWSGLRTNGTTVQPLIGVDNANNSTLVAGPSGSSAWRVISADFLSNLLYMAFNGKLHSALGFTADAGGVSSQGGGGIRTDSGSTGTGDSQRVPALSDFVSASSASGGWMVFPSFGLTASNTVVIQWGNISVPGAPTLNSAYNLPRSFPTTFAAIVISYGSNVPPNTGAVGAQPANLSQFNATNTSPNAAPNGCFFIAIGW